MAVGKSKDRYDGSVSPTDEQRRNKQLLLPSTPGAANRTLPTRRSQIPSDPGPKPQLHVVPPGLNYGFASGGKSPAPMLLVRGPGADRAVQGDLCPGVGRGLGPGWGLGEEEGRMEKRF